MKQSRYFSFGSVSEFAVGDFFQLLSLKGKPLHVDDAGINLKSNISKVKGYN